MGLSFTDLPSLSNGRLVFRDTTHFKSYLAFLDEAIEKNVDDSTSDHDVLFEIEDGMGFNSLRHITHTDYETNDALGWPSLDAIPDEHFISSPDLRSVLNADAEVKIKDQIIHYINKDIAVSVDASETDILNKFRSLGTNSTLGDALQIDDLREHSSVFKLSGSSGLFLKDPITPTGDYFIVGPVIDHHMDCSNPYISKFSNLYLRGLANPNDPDPKVSGYFIIDFGDGQSTTKSTIGTLSKVVPDFIHEYAIPGNYTVTITAKLSASGYTQDVKTESVNLSTGCSVMENSSDWQYITLTNNKYLGGKLYIEKITPFFSNEKYRVWSKSKLVKQNSNGTYSGYKGAISSTLSCKARDNNCVEIDHLQGSDARNNSKTLNIHRTGLGLFYWDLASSTHTSSGQTLNINLTPCD